MTRFMLTPFNSVINTLDDFMNLDLSRAYPPVNMYEKKDNIVVEVELSGFDPKDIQVSVVDGNLVIRGKKQVSTDNKDKRYFIREIVERSFERVIPLPVEVEENKSHAEYEKGVLRISLPKKQGLKQKNIIPIKVK